MTLIETIDMARKILKDEIDSSRTFPDNSSGWIKDDEMVEWYNLAQIEVQNALLQTHEHWFVTATSITVSANQDQYDLPCGIISILRVEDIDNTQAPIEIPPMAFNDKDHYDRNAVALERSGSTQVQTYAIKGSKIIVRPFPRMNTDIKIFYSRLVDWINTATTCSIIPNQYHELVMWGCVENGLIKGEANAEAQAGILGRRNRLMDTLFKTADRRQVQRSRKVRRRKWR